MSGIEVPQPSVQISGSRGRFPVHRIYCVGWNYAAHARESGADPEREAPFYFMKPPDAVMPNDSRVPYPPRTRNLHHEVELVVAIGAAAASGGANLSAGDAEALIFGYAVGIDLTRRDLQSEAKKTGRPWDTAKGFDYSAPLSAIHTVEQIGHPRRGRIWLEVNRQQRQEGDLDQLLWSVPEALAELSTLFTLVPGDLVFTGTPAGVGALARGDRVRGGVEGVDEIRIEIGD